MHDNPSMTRYVLERELWKEGQRTHEAFCGPSRGGFHICYCHCTICLDPDEKLCICLMCQGWHPHRENIPADQVVGD